MPIPTLLEKRLEKSIAIAKCEKAGHPNRINYNSGRMVDTGEFYECYSCPDCDKEYVVYSDAEDSQ